MQEFLNNLNIYLIPPIMFLITGVSLGVFSLVKGKRQFENVLFALVCFWYSLLMPVFISHHIFKDNIELIMKIERSIHVLYAYGPAILVLFSHTLVNKKNKIIEAGAFAVGFIISLFVFTDYYFSGVWVFQWGYIAKGGIVFQIFGFYAMSAIVYSLVLSLKKLKTDIDQHTRLKIKYIMFAVLLIGILTTGNMAALNGIDFYPPGNFAFIPMIFMAWGIYRYDVIRINLYTKRRIAGIIARIFVVAGLAAAIPVCWWALGSYNLSHIYSKTILYGLPPLLSFICCVFLSFLSLRLGENRKDSIVFSLLMLVYALLSIDIYINSIISIPETGLRVSRFSHIFVVFLPALGMHLIQIVTNRNSGKRLLYGNYIICIMLLLFTQSSYYLQGMYTYTWGLFAKKAILFDALSVLSAIALTYNIVILISAYRNTKNNFYRHRFLFLLLGSASMAVMSLGNVPAMNGYDIYPIGNFIFIPATFFAIALFRQNIPEMIRFFGMFLYYTLIAASVVSIVYILTKNHSDNFLPVYTFLSIAAILVIDYLLRRVRNVITGRDAVKLKISYENLSDKLSRVRSFDEITKSISHSFFNDLACGQCAVLIYNDKLNKYTGYNLFNTQREYINGLSSMDNSQLMNIDAGHPLLSCINSTHSYMKQEEIEFCILNNELAVDYNDPLRQCEIILPVFFENRLTAIILIGAKIDGSAFSKNETGFFYQLGINLGPHIENAFILQKLEQTLDERTRKLRDSEEKYSTLLQTNNVGFFEIDLNGNIISCNDVVVLFTGFTQDEIIGVNFSKIVGPVEIERIFNIYHKVFKKEISFGSIEHEVIRKDGTTGYIDTTVSIITDATGFISGFRTIAIDVSNRKKAEEALLESERRYRHMIENANDIIYKTDWHGNFIYSNPAFQKKFGYTVEEICNLNYIDLMPSYNRDSEFDFYKGQLVNKIDESHRELPVLAKSGEILWVEQNVKSIKDETGNIIEFDCIVHDITDRKAAEDALRVSEERYRYIIENASELIYRCNSSGFLTYANQVTLRIFGFKEADLIKTNYTDVVHPDYREKLRNFIINEFINENKLECYAEYPCIDKNGETIWLGINIRNSSGDHGQGREYYCIGRNITDRKAAEDALRESEKKYRHFIENANEIIYKADWRGNFIYSNPACAKMVEYTAEEISHLNYLDVIPPEYKERELTFYKNQLKNKIDESHRELPLITKSGKILWVEQDVRSVKDENGRIIEFDSIVHDITDRKAAEDALRKSEMHYQQLMENVSDCVFICKLDGHFKYFNIAITRLTGIPHDELIGKHFLSIVHPDYREQQLKFYQKQVFENIETTYCEFPVMMKNSMVLWVGQTVRMMKNNAGEIDFYGITRDISTIKKADDARRDLEEAKTRFFANISHEIRTPLTLMLGPIESVLQGDYGKEIGNDFFKNLHRNTLSLLKLVNNLLDFSKIEAGKMILHVQEGNIAYFARHYLSSIQLAGKAKNINLDLKSSSDSIMLFFDPERMDKVFMNLLSNALKFTGPGGTISISLIEEDDHCRIIFDDTGEGVPEKSIETIFDRFSQADTTSTRKYEGTGIGLALVKELVELHGGSISVESRYKDNYPDDHGSTFTVRIPKGIAHLENRPNIKFSEKSNLDNYIKDYRLIGINEIEESKNNNLSQSGCAEKDEPKYNGTEKTILVVDDNEDMRNFLKVLLQKHYRVILAGNGEEGICCARSEKPDLIVTDVMMPVMNGFEMTSIIKNDEVLKITPVIMLTADTELMNKVVGLENGADDYLHKPFNSMELLTRISSLLKNYEYQQIISRRNADIESELEVARLLQERLLPSSMPEISGFHEHVVYIPMDKVGGDFYDIEKRDNFIDIFIADVSGHGLPGAFLATVTKMALENITIRTSTDNVLSLLNNVIHQHTVRSNFVTAFYAMIDINTREMRYSCAGHAAPLLYRKKTDEFIELKAKGKPLGWFKDNKIEEKIIQLESCDRVVFYTDGITECSNPEKEFFEELRLQKALRDHAGKTAEEFSIELMKRLEEFKSGIAFDDDITMVVLDVL